MTDQEIYNTTVKLAVDTTKVATREDVINKSWLPFTLLYELMVSRKEIEPLRELPNAVKLKYWKETEGISFVKSRLK